MNTVYLNGVSVYLPAHAMTIAEAVLAGQYDGERARVDGFTSVCIENRLSAPEMAFEAAAVLVNDDTRHTVSNLYFASVHRHGHKLLWPAASYLQRRLCLGTRTRVTGISQGCNGGFVAASIAYDMIKGGMAGGHLVVGADRYAHSAFDRWNSDLGTLYGDGASAVILSGVPGPMRVLCCALETEPQLEEMYRDAAPATEGLADHTIKEAKKAYLEKHGRDHFNALFVGALERLKAQLLESTDIANNPVAYIVYPNVGKGLSAALYENVFGPLAQQSAWDYGRSIGHTGTSDQFIGLHWLLDQGKLASGDRVLLLGAGNGLSLGVMLIEVV